jgi:acetolactate synthase-1/2/3 large subunit
VLVDIPKDVTAAKCEYKAKPVELPERVSHTIKDEDIEKALYRISKAKKPFVFVGGGAVISEASEELRKFVELVDAPVCDTLMGKGAFDGTDDRYTGMLGMHGTKTSNLGVSECDLLIAIGSRFSDRVLGNPKKFARHAKILHIDVDPAEINKNIVADASVIGDVKEVLVRLNEKLPQYQHTEWMEHVQKMKESYPLSYNKEGLSGPFVIEKIYEMVHGDAIMVTEVGQHQMWAAQYYKYKNPRTLLSSGGLGTMGYGLGAAIGAQMANPDKQVVNIAGDGCFRMNMNELATASRNKLPLIEVIINNHVLGMVRQWQTLFYEQHYSATILDDGVDFVKVAEALGCEARRVTSQEEFEAAFAEALECKKPFVIDCIINSDDKVWPMVAPGAPINEAFDEKDVASNK